MKNLSSHFEIILITLFIAISWCQQVKVYTQPNFKGFESTFNISTCVPKLPILFSGGIHSINTQDNCAQLYNEPNCEGEYFIAKPGTQHSQLSEYKWHDSVKSLGPCHPKCHSDNIQSTKGLKTLSAHSIQITPIGRYFMTDFEFGNSRNIQSIVLSISIDGCSNIPSEIRDLKKDTTRGIESARIRFNTSICVEAHLLPNCQGATYRLTLGKSKTVYSLGVFDIQLRLDQFESFSLCGFDCKRDGTGPIGHEEELKLHAAYLCGTKQYLDKHQCHNVTKSYFEVSEYETIDQQISIPSQEHPNSPSSTTQPTEKTNSYSNNTAEAHTQTGSLLIFLAIIPVITTGTIVVFLLVCNRNRNARYNNII